MKKGVLLLGSFLFLLAGCNPKTIILHGYVDADYVYYSSPVSGILQSVMVNKGQIVSPQDLLFSLDNEKEHQDYQYSLSQVDSENAQLKDLQSGKRETELAVLYSQQKQAQAALNLAESKRRREKFQYQKRLISEFAYEQTESDYRQKAAALEEIEKRIAAESLPARIARHEAQAAAIAMAKANLAKNEWTLKNTQRNALTGGRVLDIFYRPGEWVPAGSPVVSLLPEENIKIRFFISSTQLAQLHYDQLINITLLNGLSIVARIVYISPQAEYTPPLIYSNERREQMAFLVEAKPENQVQAREELHPGMPVEVRL